MFSQTAHYKEMLGDKHSQHTQHWNSTRTMTAFMHQTRIRLLEKKEGIVSSGSEANGWTKACK